MTTPDTAPCLACLGEWPEASHRIADCGLTVAYLHADQFLPGWTVLVLKRHAAELYELVREDRGRLIEEVSAMAEALARAFQPRKINYGLLGNLLPHVHWHVIPRVADDPAPGEAPWSVPHEPTRLGAAALAERIAHIRAQLRP